jgi:hypothetical protein
MYPFEPDEARSVFALSDAIVRRRGSVLFRVETTEGREVDGHIMEIDGESSRDGVLIGGLPPDYEQWFVRFDEMIWIGTVCWLPCDSDRC